MAGLVSVSLPLSMPVVARPVEAAVRFPETRDVTDAISRELDRLLDHAPGRVSVVVMDPTGAWTFEREADRSVRAASVIKLPILAAILALAEDGAGSLDETLVLLPGDYTAGSGSLRRERPQRALALRELTERMIIESDNTATNALLRRFGLGAVDARFRRMGLAATRLERRILDGRGDNPTSARDMARLLAAIAVGDDAPSAFQGMTESSADEPPVTTGLSAESLRWMRSLLARASNRRRLGRHLPPDVALEHKTGTLHDVCHDVGIVRSEGDEIVIAALVEGAAPGEAERWLGALGRAAFTGSSRHHEPGTGIGIATANREGTWYSR
jgi:beta-lactamase class A